MTGRDFYANDLVNILMICLHEALVCFNIPEKVCVCVFVCVVCACVRQKWCTQGANLCTS